MNKKISPLFPPLKALVRLLYPKMEVVGTENLPPESALIVGNHCQLHGPIACELYFPGNRYTWCAGEMMHLQEVPRYAYQDFWSEKPRWSRPFFRLAAYLIAPLSVLVFRNARTIAVYHDSRIVSTFKNTVSRLMEGANVVIFPERNRKYNHILYDFQDKFIDVARLYYRRTGLELSFVPMYIAPNLRKIYLGAPTRFRAEEPADLERQRIRQYLMDQITAMACALPEHTVVPYRNIPKKLYPTNLPKEVHHEEADG